ncbi:MAG: alcohol dehydrogenase catalytic domain-containing protein [Candidatus Acidiferrales bacterium]
MKALVLKQPGQASIETVPDLVLSRDDILLQVRMVGFCGSDLNSFRGLNPLVSFPRILGHEVSATVVQNNHQDSELLPGTDASELGQVVYHFAIGYPVADPRLEA